MSAAEPIVHVTGRAEQRLKAGHLWIYRADVRTADAQGGDTVLVVGPHDKRLGRALYSDRSQIALRMLVSGDIPAGPSLWRERIEAALSFRQQLGIDATAYRLVHGEADLMPSFVVDRYGDYLVVQALSQAVDRMLPDLVEQLVGLLKPTGIVARHDGRVRTLEGLETGVRIVYGSVPETVVVREGPIEIEADLKGGQKTGLFLDQRENRRAATRYARGRALDCFCYTGAFALNLARVCERVEAVDISAEAVRRAAANARLNGFANVEAREANVFDELRRLERDGAAFDTIVLDPPAFAKNKAAVPKAVPGYKEINLRALKLLKIGGYLVTCSCSYHVDEAAFGQILYEAATDARARVTVVEKRTQGRDHPILLGVPETYYLKCVVLRRIG
ncbi:MAG: class I SAM-dependent rRNA methyltransferase [Vicinamibacterales bacterium]